MPLADWGKIWQRHGGACVLFFLPCCYAVLYSADVAEEVVARLGRVVGVDGGLNGAPVVLHTVLCCRCS
jgi:hypothetical protein